MDRETFLQILTPLDVHFIYRELYFRNPGAFEVPVRSWEEFCERYHALEGEEKTKLPPVPPTPIAPVFSEEEYFPREDWGAVSYTHLALLSTRPDVRSG